MKKLLTIAAAVGLLGLSTGTAQADNGWHRGWDHNRHGHAVRYAPHPVRYFSYYGPAYYAPPPPRPVMVYPVAAPIYPAPVYYQPAPVSTSFFFRF